MSLLGIDLGSGSCKGVLYDELGNILASANYSYSPYYPGPDFVLMDSQKFMNAFASVVRKLAGEHTVNALCISSHGESIVPADSNMAAISAALMNSDNRAAAEAASWDPEHVYKITGIPPHAMYSLNKIMWLKTNEPELYANTSCFLTPAGFIQAQLGMPHSADYSLACRYMALDIQKKCWSDEILDQAGIAKNKLPEPVQAGTLLGRLTAETASALNLKPGTAVVLGGHDQPCGALGAGVIEHGQVFDSAGSYECLAVTSDKPMNTASAFNYALNSYCHVLHDKYVTLAFFPAGFATRWFVEQFCGEDMEKARLQKKDVHEILDKAASELGNAPTGLCVTPHFIGSCNPNWDVNASGVIAGLTPAHTRHQVYRALYEGIACELDLNLRALEAIAGHLPEVRISGGNAKARFSVKLRADITGKSFLLSDDSDMVCRGAAMLAGKATGIFSDINEAVQAMSKPYTLIEPDTLCSAAYNQQKSRYNMIYPALTGFFHMNGKS